MSGIIAVFYTGYPCIRGQVVTAYVEYVHFAERLAALAANPSSAQAEHAHQPTSEDVRETSRAKAGW